MMESRRVRKLVQSSDHKTVALLVHLWATLLVDKTVNKSVSRRAVRLAVLKVDK